MSGSLPFVYLTTCGCVFSAAGLKAVSSSSPSSSSAGTPPNDSEVPEVVGGQPESKHLEPCPQCTKRFSRAKDVRTINPGPEEEEQMYEKMLTAAAEAKLTKQASKKRKAGVVTMTADDQSSSPPTTKRSKPANDLSAASLPQPSMNPTISTVARKVTEQLAEEEKKRKANMSDAVRSLYEPKGGVKKKETFMTMGTFTRVSFSHGFCDVRAMLTNRLLSSMLEDFAGYHDFYRARMYFTLFFLIGVAGVCWLNFVASVKFLSVAIICTTTAKLIALWAA